MAGRKPANPRRIQPGFVRVQYVRCPDCEYEGSLRNDGGAKVLGGQLRGSTVDVGVARASAGCSTCGGRGSLEVPKDNDRQRQQKLEALKAAGFDLRYIEDDPYRRRSGRWLVRGEVEE